MTRRANGEGSVYKRSDGRWCATVSLDDGRRKSFYGKTRQETGRKLATAVKARHDGLPIPAEKQTVAQFLSEWLQSTRPALRYRTWQRYEELVRLHALPTVGRLSLARLEPGHLQRLYGERLSAGQSPASVQRLHAVLHRALRDAQRWGLVARNVAALVERPRASRREMMALDPEQARSLMNAAAGERLEALYVLALTTSMRQGELLALRWPDVDLDRGALQVRGSLQRLPDGLTIVEPKTANSRRQVALTRAAVEVLRRHRVEQNEERLKLGGAWEDNGLVFANEVGRPIEVRNLMRRSFLPLLKGSSLPVIRFHDLRHTAATLLLGEGVHPKVVAEMLGHSRISTTLDLYSHVTPTMQRQAAEALDAVLTVMR